MKICMISFGPVESRSNGYFIRCYHIAKSLVKLGHEVYVLQFPEEDTLNMVMFREGIEFINLRGNEVDRNRLSGWLKNKLTFDLFHSIKFQFYSLIELIRSRGYLKNSDIIFVEGALIPFGIILAKIFKRRIVLDTHCINKLLAIHFKHKKFSAYALRKVLWDILERFSTRLSDVVIVVSEKERDYVRTEYKVSESKIFLVPNIIEIKRKHYPKEELASLRKKWNLENKIIVTFIGNLEAVQNKDAVEYIIGDLAPYFLKENKDVAFLIIGKKERTLECRLPNIIFTGFVEDLEPYMVFSDVFISPLRVGSGVKTKILYYLGYGKPMLVTPISVEGLEKLATKQPYVVVSPIEDFKNELSYIIRNLRGETSFKPPKEELTTLEILFQNNLLNAVNFAVLNSS